MLVVLLFDTFNTVPTKQITKKTENQESKKRERNRTGFINFKKEKDRLCVSSFLYRSNSTFVPRVKKSGDRKSMS